MKYSKWALILFNLFLSNVDAHSSIERFKRSFVEEDQVLILETPQFENAETLQAEDQFLFDPASDQWILSPISSSQFPYSALIELRGSDPHKLDLGEVIQYAPNALPLMISSLSRLSYSTIEKRSDQIYIAEDKTTIVKNSNEARYIVLTNLNQINLSRSSKKALPGDVAYWNECSGPVTGNYFLSHEKQLRCHQSRMISKSFQGFLQSQLPRCAQTVMNTLGIRGRVQSIHLTHTGLTGDERHRNAGGSLHNIERALDVKYLNVRLTNRKMYQFDYGNGVINSRTTDRRFFEGVRKCWQEAHLRRDRNCRINKKPNGFVASIGWEDRKHQRHLHLSYPICGQNRQGFFLL